MRARARREHARRGCAAFAALAVAASVGCARAPAARPRIEAGREILVGAWLDSDAKLAVFRGVPYAASPVGELRWRPPAPHRPRAGEQDASRFGPACPQLESNAEWYRDVARRFGRLDSVVPELEDIAEDCLYLNVWSRNLAGESAQPVMVWIHGGGNVDGYAHEPNYQGHELARRDVVVVSINYRLGALGFLAHPELSAESERGISGNYGLLDQIAALEWVRDNIARFGGDSEQVTVFGESAGAANIGTLIASPLAKGLFQRAIIQSGGYSLYDREGLRDAEAVGERFIEAIGVADGPDRLERMRALRWQQIVAAALELAPDAFDGAIVDGWLLPRPASEIFEAREQNAVPILIGSTANEWFMYLDHPVDAAKLEAELERRVREDRRAEVRAALAERAQGDAAKLDLLTGALDFHCPSLAIADAQRGLGVAVYVYRFTRVRPGGERLLAYHGAEIPYVFDTADTWLPGDVTDDALTSAVLGYWIAFSTSGDPNGDGHPGWPVFDSDRDPYLELGDEVRAAAGLQRALCEALSRGRVGT